MNEIVFLVLLSIGALFAVVYALAFVLFKWIPCEWYESAGSNVGDE